MFVDVNLRLRRVAKVAVFGQEGNFVRERQGRGSHQRKEQQITAAVVPVGGTLAGEVHRAKPQACFEKVAKLSHPVNRFAPVGVRFHLRGKTCLRSRGQRPSPVLSRQGTADEHFAAAAARGKILHRNAPVVQIERDLAAHLTHQLPEGTAHLFRILSKPFGVHLKMRHIRRGQHNFQFSVADAYQFQCRSPFFRVRGAYIPIIVGSGKNGTPKKLVIFKDSAFRS